jgi:hypothetical protein
VQHTFILENKPFLVIQPQKKWKDGDNKRGRERESER